MFCNYFCFILLIYIIFSNILSNRNNEKYFLRELVIKHINNNKRIIYLVNPTAGLGNTLRGISSIIYLSYFYNTSFFIKGWNSIKYYFHFPNELLYGKIDSSIIYYKRFSRDVLNTLNKSNITLAISEIHGFVPFLIRHFYKSKEMSVIKNVYSLSKITRNILNNIIYREFFLPTKIIREYIDVFNIKRNRKKVLGIHIRSGHFYNNFTEKYFSRVNIYKYYTQSKEIIKQYKISRIFVVSDNDYYANEIKKYFYRRIINITITGNIIHSRFSLYTKDMNYDATRIIVEFVLLSHCDVIIGTKMSSFSYESCNMLLRKCFII